MQAHSLTMDPANPIVLAAARDAPRGTIYAADGAVLADNAAWQPASARVPVSTLPRRSLATSSLIFGTAGLEKTYDRS